MNLFLQDRVYRREQLVTEATETKISANVLENFGLERSGLDDDEKMHVIGLPGKPVEFRAISKPLRSVSRCSRKGKQEYTFRDASRNDVENAPDSFFHHCGEDQETEFFEAQQADDFDEYSVNE